ncbi:hypothetical protein H0H92_001157, partial [Tricholoma furcatifolium]
MAILHKDFMAEAVRPPTEDEKEAAKEWVENHSCKAWWDGWCLVDGTLVPLYCCPYWYGQSYFDRKHRYSLNVQIDDWVVSLFKAPERDEAQNEEFNNHVSIICIHSEHAIGFLKGRFQSLKELHVNIKDEASHKFAMYW